MTSTRYFIARFAQAFGYFRRSQRLGDAASEMHLLREAEAQLGAVVWENVEDIEALSVEYWNLRKLVKERDIIRAKLATCQANLDQAHADRANLLNSTPEFHQGLNDERTALLTELEKLTRHRDQIVADAREVRRTYVGLKMKLEVLSKEASNSAEDRDALVKVRDRLIELKDRFAQLKQDRVRIGEEIEAGDAKVDLVDQKIQAQRQERRNAASDAFQVIGDCNREISVMRAESGVLDTQMRQLYGEIGRHVSRHASHDPLCAAAVSNHTGMVDVMRALRRSIALNHRLAS